MSLSNNYFNIYVNVYVHYPEVYNSLVISNRLNGYFKEFFINSKPLNSYYSGKICVMFHTAPSNENQMIRIEIEFTDEIDESLKELDVLSKWEEFLFIYFDRQIKEFYFDFTIK